VFLGKVHVLSILAGRFEEIIYLHGATPLQAVGMFEKLLLIRQKSNVWSINLDELNFSAPQLEAHCRPHWHSLMSHICSMSA
jgi:hypothetical protein